MGYSFTTSGQLVITVSQTDDLGVDLDVDLDDEQEGEPPQQSLGRELALSPVVQTLALMTLVSLVSWSTSQAVSARFFILSTPVDRWPITIITSVYSHLNVDHLIGNAVIIAIAGWIINRKSSWLRFHLFFVTTGALSGVAYVVIDRHIDWSLAATPEVSAVVGASGAGFALIGYIVTSNTLGEGIVRHLPVGRVGTMAALLMAAAVIAVWQSPPGSAVIGHAAGLFLGMAAGPFHILRAE